LVTQKLRGTEPIRGHGDRRFAAFAALAMADEALDQFSGMRVARRMPAVFWLVRLVPQPPAIFE
jgi:hypothetical protein